MTPEQFDILLQGYRQNRLSTAELDRFFQSVRDVQVQSVLEVSVDRDFRDLTVSDSVTNEEIDAAYANFLAQVPPTAAIRPMRVGRGWMRVAAAVLIVILGVSVYYFSQRSWKNEQQTVHQSSGSQDILPGSDRAVLTLSSGEKVELHPAASETIHDGALSIDNTNGQLVYKNSGVVATNTMTTPKGGQYQLTLADGTKVWLNAASAITYPTAFTGKTRQVTITGEVYFEVSADKEKPFVVHTISDDITVLGTAFNVNAYADERYMKASLAEGKIKVRDKLLQPGQAYENGQVSATNITQDIAWKNGLFYFDQAPIETVMRQIARWYDVDIVYEGNLRKAKISGEMGRNLTLQDILSILKKLHIPVRLTGKTIIVSS